MLPPMAQNYEPWKKQKRRTAKRCAFFFCG